MATRQDFLMSSRYASFAVQVCRIWMAGIALACGSAWGVTIVADHDAQSAKAGKALAVARVPLQIERSPDALDASEAESTTHEGGEQDVFAALSPEPAAPVPETQTWALMAGGLGLVMFIVRRRLAI